MLCQACKHETMHNINGCKCEAPGCTCINFETITREQVMANILNELKNKK